MPHAEDIDVGIFKLAMLGYIVYTLFGLNEQSEEFQDILKYLGVGFCVCYGRYNNNNESNESNESPNPPTGI